MAFHSDFRAAQMENRIDADQLAPPIVRAMASHDRSYYDQLRRRLRWQLLFAYCAPLGILALYFHIQYSVTLSERIHNHLRSLAENQRNTADLFVQERVANLRNAFHPDTLGIPPRDGDMDRLLAELRRASAAFVDVGVFDPAGRLVAYAGPYAFLLGKDYSGEMWYRKLLAPEIDYVVSDVYLGFRGKPHFIIAVDRTVGDRTWVLRASVDPDKFGEFVGGSAILAGAQAYIVNSKGQSQTASIEGRPELEVGPLPGRTASTSVAEFEVAGKRYLRAIAWLTVNDWALVVQVPADQAYAPLRRARAALVGIMVLTLAFIIGVAQRSTRKLVGRLEDAQEAKRSLTLHLFNAAKLASVGEIAAGVAHEINNPLAIIYEEAALMTDLLDPSFGQTMDAAELRERLGAVKEAAIRGRNITRKLLAFARQHEPELEPVRLESIVERVLKVKDVDLRTSNIEVRKEFALELPEIVASANQLEQVLLNLLNNARDAIGRNGRITLRTRVDNGWVQLDIEDTGCGMTPEVMSKVFFPFFTTKGVGKGTGLGLSISYGIIKSMGGRIEVQSRVGAGTAFTLFFPLPKPTPAHAAHEEAHRHVTGENPASHRG
jgi:two-component system NtrC family sensor kinase